MSAPERIHGFHPVREALRHRPHEVREVWIGERRSGGRAREIEELGRRHGVAVRRIPERELGAPEAVHNGFAALVAFPATAGKAGTSADAGLVVLLEDVQDPRNLGALLRVCEGAGVGRVLIRDRGSAPISETAVKASAGAAEWLAVERVTNSARAIEDLKRDGYWVYGLAAGALRHGRWTSPARSRSVSAGNRRVCASSPAGTATVSSGCRCAARSNR